MCKIDNCKVHPAFNFKGLKAEYCGSCKEPNMVNVKSKTCVHPNCNVIPLFNNNGEKKTLYCGAHKMEGMVDVKHKTCIYEGCKIRAQYNKDGETTGLYCSPHKLDGMVDVKHKTCVYKGCRVIPIFNKKDETKALYCTEHKLEDMVDVINKTCVNPNCKVLPIFNIKGETHALYCRKHKKDGMIDVKHPTCIYEGCEIRPNYNEEGEMKALYCHAHKLENMVNILKKTCIHPDCKIQPNFNKEGETKALYCLSHKMEGMIDVKHPTCKSDWCLTRVQEKYDGYCLRCFVYTFPDKPVSRNYKTKEYAVVEYVKTKFPNLPWIADKTVFGGCSKRRPDLLLDLLHQIVIIEVDENQHADYDCSCENRRIMELSQDLGHRPIIFIRFNPDDYNKDDARITSCWGQNNNGLCVVKKSKKDEWTQRLHVLEKQIEYWLNPENTTNKTIETIQLFYDS